MRCLEPSEIDRYVSGVMDRKLAEEVTSHLEICQRCRRAMAEARERMGFSVAEGERSEVRIQCTGCGARYTIPEDRVRGRVLKVRCKSCGTILEVRGSNPAGRSVLDRGRKQWYLVLHRQRVGPMTADEVRTRFQRGEIRPRTYAWRQGFARWERLQGVAEFQDLFVGTARPKRSTKPIAELAGADPGRTVPVSPLPSQDPDSGERDDSGESLDFDGGAATRIKDDTDPDLRAGRASNPELDATVPLPAIDDKALPAGSDSDDQRVMHVQLEGQGDSAGFESKLPDELSSAGAESASPETTGNESARELERSQRPSSEFERHMRGQRSEDSVLFSLSHLRRIGTRPPVIKADHSTVDSGLFEIRPVAAGPAPVLLPVEPSARRPPAFALLLAVGVSGALVGAVTLLGILYLVRPDLVRGASGSAPAATTDGQAGRAQRVAPLTPVPGSGSGSGSRVVAAPRAVSRDAGPARVAAIPKKAQPSPALAAPTKAAPKTIAAAKEAEHKPAPKKIVEASPVRRQSSDPSGASRSSSGEAASAKKKKSESETSSEAPRKTRRRPDKLGEEKQTAPAKKPDKSDEEELDRLLGRSSEKAAAKKAAKEETKQPKIDVETKKETPALSRGQIAAGMRRALAGIQVCNEKFAETGMVTVEATIEPTGRISRGRVLGAFAESPIGACVLEAVKRAARFPTFSGNAFAVQYPFVLRNN